MEESDTPSIWRHDPIDIPEIHILSDGERPDHELNIVQSVWAILDETNGSEGFVRDVVSGGIKSWKNARSYERRNALREMTAKSDYNDGSFDYSEEYRG